MNAKPENKLEADLESAVARFLAGIASRKAAADSDLLLPENWTNADWLELFRFTSGRKVAAGEALIQRGERDPTLYFVLSGSLEVIVHTGDSHSMGPLIRIDAGSVLGEQSFFDGEPRSASVWAVGKCEIAAMTREQFNALEEAQPGLARDLLFALGRILAIRLRRTTARVSH